MGRCRAGATEPGRQHRAGDLSKLHGGIAMNCRACEYTLPAGAVFCPECGVKVAVGAEALVSAERVGVSEAPAHRAAVVPANAAPERGEHGSTAPATSGAGSAAGQPNVSRTA